MDRVKLGLSHLIRPGCVEVTVSSFSGSAPLPARGSAITPGGTNASLGMKPYADGGGGHKVTMGGANMDRKDQIATPSPEIADYAS